jgi:sugar phosphate isomerase/epimerase
MKRLTRRGLLAVGAGLAMLHRAPAAPVKRVSKMRFGFTSYQWGSDWDIPTMIALLAKAKVFSTELRTSAKYAHGVELTLTAEQRREVKKQFADSPILLVGLAIAERLDSPDPGQLSAQLESAKAYVKLSQDVGGHGIRVLPNDFHPEIPHEKTIEQISRALNVLGKFAADYGQRIRLENHGSAGDLVTLKKIMEGVDQKNVGIKLNGQGLDASDFGHRFDGIKKYLDDTLHFHELGRGDFPYQLQCDLMIDAGWDGWWQLEASSKVTDRLQATIGQRELWEAMVAKSLNRPG